MKQRDPASSPSQLFSIDVQLLYRPIGLISAVVHWISEEEMHVDTGRVMLEHHSEVEITFPHQHDGHTDYHSIIAHVSRHVEGKTMLRFVRCSIDAYQALRKVMAGATATP